MPLNQKDSGGGGGGSGEANTSSNVGSGAGLAKAKSGLDLPFKSLVAGTNVTITPNTNDVTIAATGEANTVTNVGSGAPLAKTKSGVDIPLKSLVAGTNITLTQNTNDVTIAASGGVTVPGSANAALYSDGAGGMLASTQVRVAGAYVSTIVGVPTNNGVRIGNATVSGQYFGIQNNAGTADIAALYVDSGNNLSAGDGINNNAIVLQAASGQPIQLKTGGTSRLQVNGSTNIAANLSLDCTGAITATTSVYAGGGSNFRAELAPLPGFTTTFSALYLLAPATAKSASNPVVYSDGSSVYFNAPTSGTLNFMIAGATQALSATTTLIKFNLPRVGNSTPYASDGQTAVVALGTNATVGVTAAQYSRKILRASYSGSCTWNGFPLPGSDDESYEKTFRLTPGSSATLTIQMGAFTYVVGATSAATRAYLTFTPLGITGHTVEGTTIGNYQA